MVGPRSYLGQLLAALRTHWVTGLGLLAVAALIVVVNPAKLLRALGEADVAALILMLPCVLLLYVFHGIAWWVALRRLDAGVGFRPAQQVTFLSQAFVFLPGGDLWRVPILQRTARPTAPNGVLVGSVVFDDLLFTFVLSFGMLPALLQAPALAIPFALLLAPQLAVFAILLWPALYRALAARVGHLRPIRRFEPQLQMLGPAFRTLCNPRTLSAVVAADLVCAALTIALFGLGVAAVHAEGASIQRIAFTYSAGQVAAALAILPAALGAYEGMMTGLLSVQGVAPAAAAAATLLYRAVNDVLMALVGLGLALLWEGRPAVAARRLTRSPEP